MSKKAQFRIIILFLFGLQAKSNGQETRPDYSGSWTINISKSDFGKLSPEQGAARDITIIQSANDISLERRFSENEIYLETYKFNGKENAKEIAGQNSITKRRSIMKWTPGLHQFVIITNYQVKDNNGEWEYKRTETYSLLNNNTVLSLERVTAMPDRTDVVKVIYDKK